MRTALKDSPTKARLMDAAQKLVLEKGFSGTSVDDVCKAAKLTKGSFFHYFKSKEALGEELLKRYCASRKEAFATGCCQAEKDPLKRIYDFLDFIVEMAKKGEMKGCLLGSMSQELAESHPEMRSICRQGFEEMTKGMEKDLKEAKIRYKAGPSIDSKSLAEHFTLVMQGAMLMAKVRSGSSAIDGVRHYKAYLKALFGH